MKKIIALAIAGAFVAPAYAADVAITGHMEMTFADEKEAAVTDSAVYEDSHFAIKASEELANGISVSVDYALTSAGDDDGGSSLTIAGPFGTVDIGETSGPIDSIDDKTDIFNAVDSGTGLTSKDAILNWKLPTMVEGLTVITAYSPTDGADNSTALADINDGSAHSNTLGSVEKDVQGVAASYVAGPVTVSYGSQTVGTTDSTFVGLTATYQGLFVAYESASVDGGDEQNGFAVKYTMGDVVLKAATQKRENSSGVSQHDAKFMGAEYNMGALKLFLESAEEDTSGAEGTYVGVSYAF